MTTQQLWLGDPQARPRTQTNVEEIYQAYPRKVGRGAAIRAISRALRDQDPEFLLNKVKFYADCVRDKDRQFIPHPATWFNQQRYLDDPEEWKVRPKPRPDWLIRKEESAELANLKAQLIHPQDAAKHPAKYERLKHLSAKLGA